MPAQPKSYADGWEINLEKPLRSTWNGRNCKMFCLNYITGELILVKPIAGDLAGKETHSMALGKPDGEYEPEFFAEQRMLRCFFDPEANAVSICTPLVRGYSSKTGWTQIGKQNLSNLYARITPIILALDAKQKIKIATDIDNKDAGKKTTHRED